MKPIGVLSAVALALATSFGAADAQQTPAQQEPSVSWDMGSRGMGYGDMGPGMMMGYGGTGRGMFGWSGTTQAMCGAMTGHIEGRLAFIKAELKITEAQKPLRKAYAAAARENANAMSVHCTAMMSARGSSEPSLPDRLDRHEKLMAAQLDAVRGIGKTLKPLYAALSASQKKAADQLFWGHTGMM